MALGVSTSGRPCEWPKPGRSTATSRPVGARAGQMRRKANRLSGQGLVNKMTGPPAAPESAYRIRSPSTSMVCVRVIVMSVTGHYTRFFSRSAMGLMPLKEAGRLAVSGPGACRVCPESPAVTAARALDREGFSAYLMKILRDHSFAWRGGRAPQLTVNSIVLRVEQPSVRNERSSPERMVLSSPQRVICDLCRYALADGGAIPATLFGSSA